MKSRSWWWLKILLIFILPPYTEHFECVKPTDSPAVRRRHFIVDERELDITVEVSKSEANLLISNIFKILLTELVGYPNVVLVDLNKTKLSPDNAVTTLQKITNCETPKNCSKNQDYIPDVMINLGVWMNPGFNIEDWVETGAVEDCGPLGPFGRLNWYVPTYAVIDFWNVSRSVIDHWRAFQNLHIAARFNLESVEMPTFNVKLSNTYCGDRCPKDGIYRPSQCINNTCATLLAENPESFSLLKNQICELKLYVNVAWVGKDFDGLVKKLLKDRKCVLFFLEKTNALDIQYKLSPISFPHCEDQTDSRCKSDVFQLEKIAWSKIKSNAGNIYHLLRHLTIDQNNLTKLIGEYRKGITRGFTIYNAACTWVANHRVIWHPWIPDGINKIKLYIGGIFPKKGAYNEESGVIPAAHLAAEAINKNNDILLNYELEVLEQDGQCLPNKVMKSFINYISNTTVLRTLVGILGPACTSTVEPIAGLAQEFPTIIISYSAEGAVFVDREQYDYFFRTIPENNLFKNVYLNIYKEFKWTRIAAITEEGKQYPKYISHLGHFFASNPILNITLTSKEIPREPTFEIVKQYLTKTILDEKIKIIIGDFSDNVARVVMCSAYNLGITIENGYQWFLPFWLAEDWFNTDKFNNATMKALEFGNCSTAEMKAVINGHMTLAYKFYADDDEEMQENLTVRNWRDKYIQVTEQKNKKESRYAGYAYDAVWVFAMALDKLFKENPSHLESLHSNKTISRLADYIKKTNFRGVSGHVQFFGSSRISEVVIWQWLHTQRKKIGTYVPESYINGTLKLDSDIVWLTKDGKKPDGGNLAPDYANEKDCWVEAIRHLLGVSCNAATAITNVVMGLFLVLVTCIIVIYFKRRYQIRMKESEDRLKELGLISPNGKPALDEWEMPRDQIVINRKLGEGAFGTVYGGEAFIQKKGWISVAVKTLKVHAKPEEKLDFLSEADIMKKFNHINIVQLIGVCTMEEPVYTIMEFMLYGDLKTYLLGRRSLVTSNAKCEEVSDKRLTNMALDVARGLSYLADLNYVHRDLACRNCLVTANRSVKIGDFGMCRAMYDNDYYRFHRRGMLPIRWMAPESLSDGIFTTMSDIWSYGVLLFEIITFGSFPYQGLSNNQVLDHVKKCNTLEVPKGCSSELEKLLKKCWSRIPSKRPPAAEVVELLAKHPELITPCLGMPMSSVEPDNSIDELSQSGMRPIWRHKRHKSAPDTTLDTDIPQIMIDAEGNENSDEKLFSEKRYKSARQHNHKKKKKEPKLEYEPSTVSNVYEVTYL